MDLVLQLFETGTVSVCPDKIIGLTPFDFFAFRVAKRFTLFFSLSNVLKEVAPRLSSIVFTIIY